MTRWAGNRWVNLAIAISMAMPAGAPSAFAASRPDTLRSHAARTDEDQHLEDDLKTLQLASGSSLTLTTPLAAQKAPAILEGMRGGEQRPSSWPGEWPTSADQALRAIEQSSMDRLRSAEFARVAGSFAESARPRLEALEGELMADGEIDFRNLKSGQVMALGNLVNELSAAVSNGIPQQRPVSPEAAFLGELIKRYLQPLVEQLDQERRVLLTGVQTETAQETGPKHLGRLVRLAGRVKQQLQVFTQETPATAEGGVNLVALHNALDPARFTPQAPAGAPSLVIGGNWKKEIGTERQAQELARRVVVQVEAMELPEHTKVFVAPSHAHLSVVGKIVRGSRVKLAAQGVDWEEKGNRTGRHSIQQLTDLGVEYVIVGHSELREEGETDADVNKQYLLALEHGMTPVFAFGETLRERQAGPGVWKPKLRGQLTQGLAGVSVDGLERGVLAYEPLWAINTGLTATPEQANETNEFVAQGLLGLYPDHPEVVAQQVSRMYGGSVRPPGAKGLAVLPRVDGFLVGGASVDAKSFAQILQNGLEGYLERGTPPTIQPRNAYAALADVPIVDGKTFLGRFDLNISLENGHLPERPHARMVAHANSIKTITDAGGNIIVLFHQGRPGEKDFLGTPEEHAAQLRRELERLGRERGHPAPTVTVVDDLLGAEARAAMKALRGQKGQVLVLQPVRAANTVPFGTGTVEEDPYFNVLLEAYADYALLDGFSVFHRPSASVTGFTRLPHVAGPVAVSEINGAEMLRQSPKPHLEIIGGGKIPEKYGELKSGLESGRADKVLLGGRLGALALVAAQGRGDGESWEQVSLRTIGEATARDLQSDPAEFGLLDELAALLAAHRGKVELPVDVTYVDDQGQPREITLEKGRIPGLLQVPMLGQVLDALPLVGTGASNHVLSGIGPLTRDQYRRVIREGNQGRPFSSAFSVGPLADSRYPSLDQYSHPVYEEATTFVDWNGSGGGDTDVLLARKPGLKERFQYTALGGGATADYRAAKNDPMQELPGLKALADYRADEPRPGVIRNDAEAHTLAHANMLRPIAHAAHEAGGKLVVRTMTFVRGDTTDAVAMSRSRLADAVRGYLGEADDAVQAAASWDVKAQNPWIGFSMSTIRAADRRSIDAGEVRRLLKADASVAVIEIPGEYNARRRRYGPSRGISTRSLEQSLQQFILAELAKKGIRPDVARLNGVTTLTVGLPTLVQVGESGIKGELKIATFVPTPDSDIGRLMQFAHDSGVDLKALFERAMPETKAATEPQPLLGEAKPLPSEPVVPAFQPLPEPSPLEGLRLGREPINTALQTIFALSPNETLAPQTRFIGLDYPGVKEQNQIDELVQRVLSARKTVQVFVHPESPLHRQLTEQLEQLKVVDSTKVTVSSHPVTYQGGNYTAFIIQPTIRVVHVGYGNEIIKVAPAFRAAGFTNERVHEAVVVNSLSRAERVIHAFEMGYDVYVTDQFEHGVNVRSVEAFREQLRRHLIDAYTAQALDQALEGIAESDRRFADVSAQAFQRGHAKAEAKLTQIDDRIRLQFKGLFSEGLNAGLFDLVVDGTTENVGAQNKKLLYEPAAQKYPHMKFIYQGGESDTVGEVSFSAVTSQFEDGQDAQHARHVSCNTTAMTTMFGALAKALGVGIVVDNMAVRRGKDPGDIRALVLSFLYNFGYHHWPDARTVFSPEDLELIIDGNTDAAQSDSLTRFHVHAQLLRSADGRPLDKQKVQEVLWVQSRVALVDFQDGEFDSTRLNEVTHNLLPTMREQWNAWTPDGANHPLVPIVTVSETDDPSELLIRYAVPQESIVAPGNVNLAHALFGLASRDASLFIVNHAMGIVQLKRAIQTLMPVRGFNHATLEQAEADRVGVPRVAVSAGQAGAGVAAGSLRIHAEGAPDLDAFPVRDDGLRAGTPDHRQTTGIQGGKTPQQVLGQVGQHAGITPQVTWDDLQRLAMGVFGGDFHVTFKAIDEIPEVRYYQGVDLSYVTIGVPASRVNDPATLLQALETVRTLPTWDAFPEAHERFRQWLQEHGVTPASSSPSAAPAADDVTWIELERTFHHLLSATGVAVEVTTPEPEGPQAGLVRIDERQWEFVANRSQNPKQPSEIVQALAAHQPRSPDEENIVQAFREFAIAKGLFPPSTGPTQASTIASAKGTGVAAPILIPERQADFAELAAIHQTEDFVFLSETAQAAGLNARQQSVLQNVLTEARRLGLDSKRETIEPAIIACLKDAGQRLTALKALTDGGVPLDHADTLLNLVSISNVHNMAEPDGRPQWPFATYQTVGGNAQSSSPPSTYEQLRPEQRDRIDGLVLFAEYSGVASGYLETLRDILAQVQQEAMTAGGMSDEVAKRHGLDRIRLEVRMSDGDAWELVRLAAVPIAVTQVAEAPLPELDLALAKRPLAELVAEAHARGQQVTQRTIWGEEADPALADFQKEVTDVADYLEYLFTDTAVFNGQHHLGELAEFLRTETRWVLVDGLPIADFTGEVDVDSGTIYLNHTLVRQLHRVGRKTVRIAFNVRKGFELWARVLGVSEEEANPQAKEWQSHIARPSVLEAFGRLGDRVDDTIRLLTLKEQEETGAGRGAISQDHEVRRDQLRLIAADMIRRGLLTTPERFAWRALTYGREGRLTLEEAQAILDELVAGGRGFFRRVERKTEKTEVETEKTEVVYEYDHAAEFRRNPNFRDGELYVLPFSVLDGSEVPFVGGKVAAGLVRGGDALGVKVEPGFAVTTQAFDDRIMRDVTLRVDGRSRTTSVGAVRTQVYTDYKQGKLRFNEAADRMKGIFDQTPLPAPVEEAIRDAYWRLSRSRERATMPLAAKVKQVVSLSERSTLAAAVQQQVKEQLQQLRQRRHVLWDQLQARALSVEEVITELGHAGVITPQVADALQAAYRDYGGIPVAVRSSGTQEDVVDPFAGLYKSFLGVVGAHEVVDAVRKVQDSIDEARGIEYREDRGYSSLQGKMAVAVHPLAIRWTPDGELAKRGVVSVIGFTHNKDTGAPVRVINATFGYGPPLVGGEVAGDRYKVLTNGYVAERVRGEKHEMMVLLEGRSDRNIEQDENFKLARVPVEERDREQFALNEAQLKAYNDQLSALEWFYEYDVPLDTEGVFLSDQDEVGMAQASHWELLSVQNRSLVVERNPYLFRQDKWVLAPGEREKVGEPFAKGVQGVGAGKGVVYFLPDDKVARKRVMVELIDLIKQRRQEFREESKLSDQEQALRRAEGRDLGIVVACSDLLPEDAPLIQALGGGGRIGAIVTARGAPAAHAGIIAGQYNTPWLVAIGVKQLEALRAWQRREQDHQRPPVVTVSVETGELFLGELELTYIFQETDMRDLPETETDMGQIRNSPKDAEEGYPFGLALAVAGRSNLDRAEFVAGEAVQAHPGLLVAYDDLKRVAREPASRAQLSSFDRLVLEFLERRPDIQQELETLMTQRLGPAILQSMTPGHDYLKQTFTPPMVAMAVMGLGIDQLGVRRLVQDLDEDGLRHAVDAIVRPWYEGPQRTSYESARIQALRQLAEQAGTSSEADRQTIRRMLRRVETTHKWRTMDWKRREYEAVIGAQIEAMDILFRTFEEVFGPAFGVNARWVDGLFDRNQRELIHLLEERNPVVEGVRLADLIHEYEITSLEELFEHVHEANYLIGHRGGGRNIDPHHRRGFDLTVESYKDVRGLDNPAQPEVKNEHYQVMIPMVRTPEEAIQQLLLFREQGLERGQHGLQLAFMAEVPSLIIWVDDFLYRPVLIPHEDAQAITALLDGDLTDEGRERAPAALRRHLTEFEAEQFLETARNQEVLVRRYLAQNVLLVLMVDELSIGTNDLIQFATGVDRNYFDDPEVRFLYTGSDWTILELMRHLGIRAGLAHAKCALCGAFASLYGPEALVEAGVNPIGTQAPALAGNIRAIARTEHEVAANRVKGAVVARGMPVRGGLRRGKPVVLSQYTPQELESVHAGDVVILQNFARQMGQIDGAVWLPPAIQAALDRAGAIVTDAAEHYFMEGPGKRLRKPMMVSLLDYDPQAVDALSRMAHTVGEVVVDAKTGLIHLVDPAGLERTPDPIPLANVSLASIPVKKGGAVVTGTLVPVATPEALSSMQFQGTELLVVNRLDEAVSRRLAVSTGQAIRRPAAIIVHSASPEQVAHVSPSIPVVVVANDREFESLQRLPGYRHQVTIDETNGRIHAEVWDQDPNAAPATRTFSTVKLEELWQDDLGAHPRFYEAAANGTITLSGVQEARRNLEAEHEAKRRELEQLEQAGEAQLAAERKAEAIELRKRLEILRQREAELGRLHASGLSVEAFVKQAVKQSLDRQRQGTSTGTPLYIELDDLDNADRAALRGAGELETTMPTVPMLGLKGLVWWNHPEARWITGVVIDAMLEWKQETERQGYQVGFLFNWVQELWNLKRAKLRLRLHALRQAAAARGRADEVDRLEDRLFNLRTTVFDAHMKERETFGETTPNVFQYRDQLYAAVDQLGKAVEAIEASLNHAPSTTFQFGMRTSVTSNFVLANRFAEEVNLYVIDKDRSLPVLFAVDPQNAAGLVKPEMHARFDSLRMVETALVRAQAKGVAVALGMEVPSTVRVNGTTAQPPPVPTPTLAPAAGGVARPGASDELTRALVSEALVAGALVSLEVEQRALALQGEEVELHVVEVAEPGEAVSVQVLRTGDRSYQIAVGLPPDVTTMALVEAAVRQELVSYPDASHPVHQMLQALLRPSERELPPQSGGADGAQGWLAAIKQQLDRIAQGSQEEPYALSNIREIWDRFPELRQEILQMLRAHPSPTALQARRLLAQDGLLVDVGPMAGEPELAMVIDFAALFPDAVALVEMGERESIPMAVGSGSATSRNLAESQQVGDRTLRSYFGSFVTGADVPPDKAKPDPAIFWIATEELQARPAQTVVVGDGTRDMEAARAGGFVGVGVHRPGGDSPEALLAAGADVVVNNLTEITLPFLRELGANAPQLRAHRATLTELTQRAEGAQGDQLDGTVNDLEQFITDLRGARQAASPSGQLLLSDIQRRAQTLLDGLKPSQLHPEVRPLEAGEGGNAAELIQRFLDSVQSGGSVRIQGEATQELVSHLQSRVESPNGQTILHLFYQDNSHEDHVFSCGLSRDATPMMNSDRGYGVFRIEGDVDPNPDQIDQLAIKTPRGLLYVIRHREPTDGGDHFSYEAHLLAGAEPLQPALEGKGSVGSSLRALYDQFRITSQPVDVKAFQSGRVKDPTTGQTYTETTARVELNQLVALGLAERLTDEVPYGYQPAGPVRNLSPPQFEAFFTQLQQELPALLQADARTVAIRLREEWPHLVAQHSTIDSALQANDVPGLVGALTPAIQAVVNGQDARPLATIFSSLANGIRGSPVRQATATAALQQCLTQFPLASHDWLSAAKTHTDVLAPDAATEIDALITSATRQGATTIRSTKKAPNAAAVEFEEARWIESEITKLAPTAEIKPIPQGVKILMQERGPPDKLLDLIARDRLRVKVVDLGDEVLLPRRNGDDDLGLIAFTTTEADGRHYINLTKALWERIARDHETYLLSQMIVHEYFETLEGPTTYESAHQYAVRRELDYASAKARDRGVSDLNQFFLDYAVEHGKKAYLYRLLDEYDPKRDLEGKFLRAIHEALDRLIERLGIGTRVPLASGKELLVWYRHALEQQLETSGVPDVAEITKSIQTMQAAGMVSGQTIREVLFERSHPAYHNGEPFYLPQIYIHLPPTEFFALPYHAHDSTGATQRMAAAQARVQYHQQALVSAKDGERQVAQEALTQAYAAVDEAESEYVKARSQPFIDFVKDQILRIRRETGNKRLIIPIVGAGGGGKSSLVRNLEEALQAAGLRVAWGGTDGLLLPGETRYRGRQPDGQRVPLLQGGSMYAWEEGARLLRAIRDGRPAAWPKDIHGQMAEHPIEGDLDVFLLEGVVAAHSPVVRHLVDLTIGISESTDDIRYDRRAIRDMRAGGSRAYTADNFINTYARNQIKEQHDVVTNDILQAADLVWRHDIQAIYVRKGSLILPMVQEYRRVASSLAYGASRVQVGHPEELAEAVEEIRDRLRRAHLAGNGAFAEETVRHAIQDTAMETPEFLPAMEDILASGDVVRRLVDEVGRDVEFVHLVRQVADVARNLDFTPDNAQTNPSLFRDTAYNVALVQRDEAVKAALAALTVDAHLAEQLLEQLRLQLAPDTAQQTLDRFGWTAQQAAAVVRLLQYRALEAAPIQTDLHGSHYEWAGETIRRLFQSPERWSEVWPFFSDRIGMGPAPVTGTTFDVNGAHLGPITMRDLVKRQPETFGPQGLDPQNDDQKYFFVKFLDPSDFPEFAYVGFNPEEVSALGLSPEAFKAHFADLLWQDRQAVEAFYALVHERMTSQEQFERLKASYKDWAIGQAYADWSGPLHVDALSAFVPGDQQDAYQRVLAQQQQVRRQIVRLMHRIDYEDGQAILIETPTIHGIAGLSIQTHPNVPGNYYPKDELWIYKQVPLPDGRSGWVLVEPQRTYDKTESGADFFTPFAWTRDGLGFRKAMTQQYLTDFVNMMDATPKPRAHYLRRAEPMAFPNGATTGSAQWFRTVEEPGWPYFLVRELRFGDAGGSATNPLERHSFTELHVTEGTVEVTLSRAGQPTRHLTITPTQPALLRPVLPYDTVTFIASGKTQLQYFARPASGAETSAEVLVAEMDHTPTERAQAEQLAVEVLNASEVLQPQIGVERDVERRLFSTRQDGGGA